MEKSNNNIGVAMCQLVIEVQLCLFERCWNIGEQEQIKAGRCVTREAMNNSEHDDEAGSSPGTNAKFRFPTSLMHFNSLPVLSWQGDF